MSFADNLPPGCLPGDVEDRRPHCVWCGREFSPRHPDQEMCPRCERRAEPEAEDRGER